MGKLYKDKITVQGTLAFLDFLPTMNVVKEKYKPPKVVGTEIRSCKHCSEEYVIETNSVRKYCSTACRLSFVKEHYHNNHTPREFVCETCNKKVTTEHFDKRTKYCSVACRKKNFANRLIKLPTKRLCNFCGDEFEGTSVYCSKQCQGNQHTLNNKNPVGHVKRTEGVHERICCYDEVHIPEEVMFILECQDDYLRITEDTHYILSCLDELPLAKYSDGKRLHNTEAYQERRGKGFTVGFNNYKPQVLGSKRVEPTPTEYKQYATTEDKMAVLEREYPSYTVLDDG
tara:strand:+ start:6633 stop:7490 length:858 start_codon:yes stop_codon:yes gene_type:complete